VEDFASARCTEEYSYREPDLAYARQKRDEMKRDSIDSAARKATQWIKMSGGQRNLLEGYIHHASGPVVP
jgi:hypothetical protein